MPTNQQSGQSPYADWDGGKAVRLLDPCDDESCDWVDDPALYMTSRRWYPTLETLEDGSAIIMGGCGELSALVLSYFFESNCHKNGEDTSTMQTIKTTLPWNIFLPKASRSPSTSFSTPCL